MGKGEMDQIDKIFKCLGVPRQPQPHRALHGTVNPTTPRTVGTLGGDLAGGRGLTGDEEDAVDS